MGDEGDRVAMRFARGCRAFAATLDEVVVSYGWLSRSTEWIGELGIEITPADGEAYVWNCFTLPEHRRRGHYRRVLEGIVATAHAGGLRRLWIGSVDVPAEKADVDAGFVRVLRFDIAHEGGLRRLTVSAVADAGDALVEEARRRLGLEGWMHLAAATPRKH
jgi:hypothetical protein